MVDITPKDSTHMRKGTDRAAVDVHAARLLPRQVSRINEARKQVDVDETLPLDRTRTAARQRQDTTTSAVDAVVAEAAARTRAAFLVTSDPEDMTALLERTGATTQVVTV